MLRRRHGRKPARERGRPARTTPARPRPTPRPGSTGNGAGTLLRPGPCLSRRQGDQVPHRRETERHATAEHAGETPALPGGPLPIAFVPHAGVRRIAGPQPCRCGRAVTLGGPSSSFVALSGFLFFRLFQPSATAPDFELVKAEGGVPKSPARISTRIGALNSAVECHLHTVEVTGSNPVAPTIPFLPKHLIPKLSRLQAPTRQGPLVHWQ